VTGVAELLERDSELALVERLIGDVEAGAGRVAIIEGSAVWGALTRFRVGRPILGRRVVRPSRRPEGAGS
jgi:hypothetical protein